MPVTRAIAWLALPEPRVRLQDRDSKIQLYNSHTCQNQAPTPARRLPRPLLCARDVAMHGGCAPSVVTRLRDRISRALGRETSCPGVETPAETRAVVGTPAQIQTLGEYKTYTATHTNQERELTPQFLESL